MSAGFEQAVQRVDASLRLATSSAAKVKTLVDEIKAGGEEQARGIEQIAKAISQMEQLGAMAGGGAVDREGAWPAAPRAVLARPGGRAQARRPFP